MIDPSTRYGLLKILADNPEPSQRDLAKRLGAGCLKVGNFRNSKLAYTYLLTSQGIEQKGHIAIAFLQIKMREYERLRTEMVELKRETEQGEFRGSSYG